MDLEKASRRKPTPSVEQGLPPHNTESEQGVLGCVFEAPESTLATLIERRVTALWFYDLRHQVIFNAMLALYAQKDVAVDIITLQQRLKESGELEQIGGIPYLNALQDAVPAGAANLTYYLDYLRDKMRARKLLAWSAGIAPRVQEAEDMDQLHDEVEADWEALTAPDVVRTEHHIKDVILNSVMPLIERHYARGKTQLDGLATGENWYLDKVLLGIAPADYVILAGRPGEGKTSLALNVVNYLAKDYVHWTPITAAEYEALPAGERSKTEEAVTEDKKVEVYSQRHQGIPIGIFTLEMTEESLGFRLVFGRAGVSSGAFRQGFASKDMWAKVNKSVVELCKANIYLDGEADQTMDMIAAKARRWAKQYGIKLFVLDYLQLLDSDDGETDRVRVLRKISKKIVSLKKRLGIPWLVLAQMNRNIETAERARRPVMSDLKESGSLEQDADKIIILYHPLKSEGVEDDETKIDDVMTRLKVTTQSDFPRRINALVVKNRNGPTGVAALLFQNNQCLFQDWRRWCVEHGVAQGVH